MNFFSKNLSYLRKENKVSRNELADKIGVNQSTISRWENEDMGVTVENAYDVANFFKISIADLVGKDLEKDIKQFDELEILLSKNKDLLTDDDKETIKFILEKARKKVDKHLDGE